MAGHFGVKRTYNKFYDNYFWPKALEDVDNFVKSCKECNEFNHPRTKYTKAPLQPIPTTRRFELVCYDLAGPFLPQTVRGMSYALTIVDHYTHWTEFVPLENIEAPTIATALVNQWCCRYGVPENFHSDGASNVHGKVMEEVARRLGVHKSKSSRLHPQGDGMAESFVKQLKVCIQKQVEKNGSDWDLYLDSTAFAIRSNTTYNTKFSPAELVIGAKLVQPIDDIVDNVPKTYPEKQAHAFAKQLTDKLKESYIIANENLKLSRNKMKEQYDKKASAHSFSVGDNVMLWKPYKRNKLSRCFQPNWDGPWVIQYFTGDSNCKMFCEDTNKYINVHVNQLKAVRTRPSNITVPELTFNRRTQHQNRTNTGSHEH